MNNNNTISSRSESEASSASSTSKLTWSGGITIAAILLVVYTVVSAHVYGFNLATMAAGIFSSGTWLFSALTTLGHLTPVTAFNPIVGSAAMVAGGLLSVAGVIRLSTALLHAAFKACSDSPVSAMTILVVVCTAVSAYVYGFNLATMAAGMFSSGTWLFSALTTLGHLTSVTAFNPVVGSAAMVAGGLLSVVGMIGLSAGLFYTAVTLAQQFRSDTETTQRPFDEGIGLAVFYDDPALSENLQFRGQNITQGSDLRSNSTDDAAKSHRSNHGPR